MPGGTEGKVVFLSHAATGPLWLWDPVTEQKDQIEPLTYDPDNTAFTPGPARTEIHGLGLPSTPVWSPDGTKFAYSKNVADQGNITGLEHTSIWVYDLVKGTSKQVTTPDDALWDTAPGDPPHIGHLVFDVSPIWSADGSKIAFVRSVGVLGADDALYGQRGQNLWIVPSSGGEETQVTTFTEARIQGGVWIPGTNDLVVSFFPADGFPFLGRLPATGGVPQLVAGGTPEAIVDYDVSPDGKLLAYNTLGAGGGQPFVQPLDGSAPGHAVSGARFGAVARFSGSGDGLLHQDCTTGEPSVCGLMDRPFDDAEADIRPGSERLALAFNETTPGSGVLPARSALDIQRQTLPVIFVPGFLGTDINCGAKQLWPNAPFPDPLGMRLAPDGLTNAGCAAATPGNVVDTVLFKDIYDTVGDYVNGTLEQGRGTMFGWDWRKRPQASLDRLDTAVTAALLRPGRWKDQGAARVVLWGHSYGGLLIRTYLDQHPERVARVLTVGTPSWGAPKTIFPFAYGIETPEGGPGMDWIFKNAELRELALNLGGLYQLFPSARFTASWLRTGGVPADPAAFVTQLGGPAALYGEAQGYHDAIYDRFTDHDGRIDVKSVVGTGVPTFGAVDISAADVAVTWVNGDGTVPGLSATQGPIGPLPAPPAAQIHIQDTCGVAHVPLVNDAKVMAAYEDWVEIGRVPRKLPGPCDANGGVTVFEREVLGAHASARRAAAGAPQSLRAAEEDGLIDVVDLPGHALVVTDDHHPVTLSVRLNGTSFTYSPITAAGQGATLTYGPLSGEVQISSPTAPGAAPLVTLNGVAVEPHPAPGGGGGPGGQTPPPGGGGPPVSKQPSNRFKLIGTPRRRGRTVRLVVKLPGPGRLQVRATLTRGKRALGVGRTTTAVRRAGRVKVALRLKRVAPGRLSLGLTYTPTGGTPRTLVKRVR